MSSEYTTLQKIAEAHTQPFVLGLEYGLEVASQYQEIGKPLESLSPQSDAFQIASNRMALRDGRPVSYGEIEFTVAGMGIATAIEEATRRQGVSV
jgi:hypothetical protein